MGLGLIRDCIAIMNEADGPLGHVNRYLPQQPSDFNQLLSDLESETMQLARDPFNTSDDYWRRVVELLRIFGWRRGSRRRAMSRRCAAVNAGGDERSG